MIPKTAIAALATALVLACASGQRETDYVRSPSLDYGREPPRTTDNRVVGADGVDPHDRLQEGMRLGRPNALAPGWSADEKGIVYKPEERVGGYGATSQEEAETERNSADAGAPAVR